VSRDSQSAGHEALARREESIERAPTRNSQVEQVAKLYEKQFLREMVKAMRGTVQFSDMTKPNMAENIYRDQLDDQYVESWGDQGGFGLSELIYDQIMERYFNQSASQQFKKQGPIELSDRDVLKVARVKVSGEGESIGAQVPLRVELRTSGQQKPAQITSPWDGEILHASRVGDRTAVSILHTSPESDDGSPLQPTRMRSTLIFEGVIPAEVQAGRKIAKGGAVGLLNPEINSFFWNLKQVAAGEKSGSNLGLAR
jgi:flagellar protein FlgJ